MFYPLFFFFTAFAVGSLSYFLFSKTNRHSSSSRILTLPRLTYSAWTRLHKLYILLIQLEGLTRSALSVRLQHFLLLLSLLYTLLFLLPLFLLPYLDYLFQLPTPTSLLLFTKWVYLSNHPYEAWSGYTHYFLNMDHFNLKKTGFSKTLHIISYIRFWSGFPIGESLSLLLLFALPVQLYTLSKVGSYSLIWSWDKRLWRKSKSHTVALLTTANELCFKTNLLLLPLFLLHFLIYFPVITLLF